MPIRIKKDVQQKECTPSDKQYSNVSHVFYWSKQGQINIYCSFHLNVSMMSDFGCIFIRQTFTHTQVNYTVERKSIWSDSWSNSFTKFEMKRSEKKVPPLSVCFWLIPFVFSFHLEKFLLFYSILIPISPHKVHFTLNLIHIFFFSLHPLNSSSHNSQWFCSHCTLLSNSFSIHFKDVSTFHLITFLLDSTDEYSSVSHTFSWEKIWLVSLRAFHGFILAMNLQPFRDKFWRTWLMMNSNLI